MPRSEALKRSQAKYEQSEKRKNSYKMFAIKLFRSTDEDIIKHLEQQSNKADYIRKLIRKDMEENNNDETGT